MDLDRISSALTQYKLQGADAEKWREELRRRYQTPVDNLGGRTFQDVVTFLDKDKVSSTSEGFEVDLFELGEHVQSGPDTEALAKRVLLERERELVTEGTAYLKSLVAEAMESSSSSKIDKRLELLTKANALASEPFESFQHFQAAIAQFTSEHSAFLKDDIGKLLLTKLTRGMSRLGEDLSWDNRYIGKIAFNETRSHDLLQQIPVPRSPLGKWIDTHKLPPLIRPMLEACVIGKNQTWAQLTDVGLLVGQKLKHII